jgi:hypothetical protein
LGGKTISNGGGHLIFVIDEPIAALLDGLPVENHAHHESERQRLTGRRSFIFNAKGIAGFVPGAVPLGRRLPPEPKLLTRARGQT